MTKKRKKSYPKRIAETTAMFTATGVGSNLFFSTLGNAPSNSATSTSNLLRQGGTGFNLMGTMGSTKAGMDIIDMLGDFDFNKKKKRR